MILREQHAVASTLIIWEDLGSKTQMFLVPNNLISIETRLDLKLAHNRYINEMISLNSDEEEQAVENALYNVQYKLFTLKDFGMDESDIEKMDDENKEHFAKFTGDFKQFELEDTIVEPSVSLTHVYLTGCMP